MARRDRICRGCKHFVYEPPEVEGECIMKEDVDEETYCESYEAEE